MKIMIAENPCLGAVFDAVHNIKGNGNLNFHHAFTEQVMKAL